jgi:hypothetical protein
MEKTRKPTRNTARHDEAVDKLANMLWLGPKANEPIAEGFKTISEEMSQALTGINKRNVNLLSKLIPDLTDSETLLHMAAKMQWEEVVQALLDKGADPNARGSNGGTPMHAVAFSPLLRVISYERAVSEPNADVRIAHMLRAAGAKARFKTHLGATPRDIAGIATTPKDQLIAQLQRWELEDAKSLSGARKTVAHRGQVR